VAVTVSEVLPPVHMAALTGFAEITTGKHVEFTVTVRGKVFPVQVPFLGVTVYMAVPVPESIERVPLMLVAPVNWASPPVTPLV